LTGPDAGVEDIEREELFTDYEQLLFTRVVAVAERHGRSVKLLVVPATNVFDAVAQTAMLLRVGEIVVGESAKMPASEQARLLGDGPPAQEDRSCLTALEERSSLRSPRRWRSTRAARRRKQQSRRPRSHSPLPISPGSRATRERRNRRSTAKCSRASSAWTRT